MTELSEEVAHNVGCTKLEEHDLAHQIEVQSRAIPLAVMLLASEVGHLRPDQHDDVEHQESRNQVRAAQTLLQLAQCHEGENRCHHMEREQAPQYYSDTATVKWILSKHPYSHVSKCSLK